VTEPDEDARPADEFDRCVIEVQIVIPDDRLPRARVKVGISGDLLQALGWATALLEDPRTAGLVARAKRALQAFE